MAWPFLEAARAALGLSDAEVEFLRVGAIRSFDEFHAVLVASPSLDAPGSPVRRGELIGRMEAIDSMLSPEYQRALQQPRLSPMVIGGAGAPTAADDGGALGPPANWPAPLDAQPLGSKPADAANLALPQLRRLWPIRDQEGAPSCVGFATGGAIERAWMPPAAASPDELSAVFLYNRSVRRIPPGRQPPGAAQGASRLEAARAAMLADGICPAALWPDRQAHDAEPSDAAKQAAAPNRTDRLVHFELSPLRVQRPGNVARIAFDLLSAGLPVAVALPLFRDPRAGPTGDNWNYPYAVTSGKVADRQVGWEELEIGHAVCMLAFQPDPQEPAGGWFIFRNSVGEDWCTSPNLLVNPRVPARGWGALSATMVNEHAWEMLAVIPGAPN
jgi:hypothetical protein